MSVEFDSYEVVSVAQAVEDQVPGAEDYHSDWNDNDWNALIIRYGPEGQVILASDGGEPEDNSFFRDGAWIPGALQEAFHRGVKYGREHGACCAD